MLELYVWGLSGSLPFRFKDLYSTATTNFDTEALNSRVCV